MQDTDETESWHERFGSTHASSMNMALCDGSVQTIDYDIDQQVWEVLVRAKTAKSHKN